jgi:hypothetical protein
LLIVAAKSDPDASPAAYLNTLCFDLSGGPWMSLEIALVSELAEAAHFHFGMSALVSRSVQCRLVLRRLAGESREQAVLKEFRLEPDEPIQNFTGELPPAAGGQPGQLRFILVIEAGHDLVLDLNYLDLYVG